MRLLLIECTVNKCATIVSTHCKHFVCKVDMQMIVKSIYLFFNYRRFLEKKQSNYLLLQIYNV